MPMYCELVKEYSYILYIGDYMINGQRFDIPV